MFDWGFYEMIMWQIYRDRLREAEKDRLAGQARTGYRRRFQLLASAQSRSERRLLAQPATRSGHVCSAVEETAKLLRSGGGLIL